MRFLKLLPFLAILVFVVIGIVTAQNPPGGYNSPSTSGGSGTINSGTTGNIPDYSAATTLSDSGIAASNLVQLAVSGTQTIQNTGNANTLIVKQSAGGGQPFFVQTSSGAAIQSSAIGGTFQMVFPGGIGFQGSVGNSANSHIMISLTAPTIAGAGCGGSGATIPVNNGTISFQIGVGATPTTGCTVTLPSATTDWNCTFTDATTQSTSVFLQKQSAWGTATASFVNYNTAGTATNLVASDVIHVSCAAE